MVMLVDWATLKHKDDVFHLHTTTTYSQRAGLTLMVVPPVGAIREIETNSLCILI
jgi:hypothetical protein